MRHSSVLTRFGLAAAVSLVFVAAGCSGSSDTSIKVSPVVPAPVVNAPANIPPPTTTIKVNTNTSIKATAPVTKPATGSGTLPTNTGADINGKIGPEPGM